MKQAIKLYTTIRKNQFIMASLLGIFLIVFAVGSNLLFRNIPNQETDYELGPVLMVVWLIVTVIVLLNDQSRHLDTWLYTQNISRGQLFLTRVILMVVGPIIAASVIDICLTAMLEYHNISRVLMVDITAAANLFFISSVFIGIFIVIGPNWMKAAGTVFTFGAGIMVGPIFNNVLGSRVNTDARILMVTIIAALVIFIAGYYCAINISDDTLDEAVRIRYLKWPVVIFVFVSTLTVTMSNPNRNTVGTFLAGFILPLICAAVTFGFIFKPTLKVTWDK